MTKQLTNFLEDQKEEARKQAKHHDNLSEFDYAAYQRGRKEMCLEVLAWLHDNVPTTAHKLESYIVTFGGNHELGLNAYVQIDAPNYDEARAAVVERFGIKWSFLYTEEKFNSFKGAYPYDSEPTEIINTLAPKNVRLLEICPTCEFTDISGSPIAETLRATTKVCDKCNTSASRC